MRMKDQTCRLSFAAFPGHWQGAELEVEQELAPIGDAGVADSGCTMPGPQARLLSEEVKGVVMTTGPPLPQRF